jgi:hypothetical protein
MIHPAARRRRMKQRQMAQAVRNVVGQSNQGDRCLRSSSASR